MRVFVLDKNLIPLDPCHPARARELLNKRRARIYKRYPFTIILPDRTVEESIVHPHRIKIDPGSKISGITVLQEETGRVTSALEIEELNRSKSPPKDTELVSVAVTIGTDSQKLMLQKLNFSRAFKQEISLRLISQ